MTRGRRDRFGINYQAPAMYGPRGRRHTHLPSADEHHERQDMLDEQNCDYEKLGEPLCRD